MKKILSIVFLNPPASVYAENIGKTQPLSDSLSRNSWEPNYLMMLTGLFLVIGLVYLTAYIYQKMLKIKFDNNLSAINAPKVLATTPLGQNKNLHIVKVCDEYILIGSSPDSVTYIKNLEYFEGD